MAEPLPPDLSRLGDAIESATARRARVDARRATRRRQLAATALAVALAVAVIGPGTSGRHPGGDLALSSARAALYHPMACDQPRGATFAAVRPCATPGVTDVT